MKQTLLLILTLALGIGCKDKKDQQIWMRSNDYTSWRGEGYSEDSIHVCVYDSCIADSMSGAYRYYTSCRHIIKDTALKSKWTDGVRLGPRTSELVTKWTDASKASRGYNFIIKDTVPKPTGKVLTWGENPLIMGGSGYVLGTDSLGNIIEDKGIPTWKEVSGGGRVRAWPDTNHIYYNPSKDSLP